MPDQSAMRRGLRQDIEELNAVEREIVALEHELACTMETYRRTHLRLSNLRRHHTLLAQRRESTLAVLNTLATFPRELLSLIFAFACTESSDMYCPGLPDTKLEPTRFLDNNRIAAPWRISLVCRHWRDVVLSTRDAWSYIGISFTPGAGPDVISTESMNCHGRVRAVVEKSGSALLDVVIAYRGSNARGSGTGEGASSARRALLEEEHNFFWYIFSMLHANMHRVRSLHVYASNPLPSWLSIHAGFTTTREKVENLLRSPCPSLVDLRISFCYKVDDQDDEDEFWHGFPDKPIPLFLPHAPKLQTLSLHNIPIVCRRPHPGLPSLRRLSIRQAIMYSVHMADMLACAPNLEYLFINVEEALEWPDAINFEPALHLSKLNIASEDVPFELLADGGHLFPNLTELRIPHLSALWSVSDHLARGLKKLCVFSQRKLEKHLDILRQLAALEEVEFEEGCSMHDDLFFAPLCAAEDTMWPNLRILRLSAALLSVEKDGLLQLVRARNATDGPGVARPLERVDFSLTRHTDPTWLEAPIRAIIPEVDGLS